MSHPVRSALTAAVLGAAVAGTLAAPAHAGGPGQVYVYGATSSKCTDNLNYQVQLYRHHGYTVTGIHGCRLTGDRSRYFGDFVAN